MNYRKFWYLLFFVLGISCKTEQNSNATNNESPQVLAKTSKLKNWYTKDIDGDSIAGISLEKAYDKLIQDKKGDTIIVAVLDTEIDINHEDLKSSFWINQDEIPNNGIDDDHNGYIDDINGWNFLGNSKGENTIFTNFEITRIVKKYDSKFKNLKKEDFSDSDLELFKVYERAKEAYNINLKNSNLDLEYVNAVVKKYRDAKKALKEYFPNGDYSKERLSQIEIDSSNNILSKHLAAITEMIKYDISEKQMQDQVRYYQNHLDYYLNINYDDRKIIGDNPDNLDDKKYGNNDVSGNIEILYHGTLVAGVIAASRNNEVGIDGISNNIKIMPLCISANGDEHDKDIANAIRYAVDNGAKIINMSSSKKISLHQNWVTDALIYADKNDVLFVMAIDNDGLNYENVNNHCFPSSKNSRGKDFEKSFIMVGGSDKSLDKNLKSSFSSYGKNTVDIFAPSNDIYTTKVNNEYIIDRGNSLAAPITAGVAALLKSYYPKLTSRQLKEIILASGTSHEVDVEILQPDETTKLIPFSELSKSGKIVNAYNALLMAEKITAGEK